MEVKPGYKMTQVGVIPEEWEVSTVGQQFEIKLGKMLDAGKNVGVAKPYLGNRAVQWGQIETDNLPTVPMTRTDIERFRLQKGDLLVCEGGEVGRAAVWEAPIKECYYQKALHRLRPLLDFDSRLMVSILRVLADRGILANYVTQTSIAHLPRDKFMSVIMPVPPLSEQRTIAETLGEVDELLGGLDILVGKKRDIKQAAMQQLLTGQTRLPGFYGEWETKRLGDVISVLADYTANGSFEALKTNVTYYESRNYAALVRTTDFNKAKFIPERFTDEKGYRFLAKTSLFGGEIIVANVGSIGKVFRVPFFEMPMTLAPNTYLLKFDAKTDENFIYQWLKTDDFYSKLKSKIGSTTLQAINKDNLRSIEFCAPREISEQTAIAALLADMDGEIAALEQRREKTRFLKQAMMQELLSGRTRLI